MDIKEKYLEYKKKYLELKNKSRINLSGIDTIAYFIHPTLNKKIILVGGQDSASGDICGKENFINIDKYFENLIKKETLQIDFFIDSKIPDDKSRRKADMKKYSDNIIRTFPKDIIIKLFLENYKRDNTKRFHFTDVKEEIFGGTAKTFHNMWDLVQRFKIKEVTTTKHPLVFFEPINREFYSLLGDFKNKLEEKDFDDSNHILKELKKIKPEISNLLFKKVINDIKSSINIIYPSGFDFYSIIGKGLEDQISYFEKMFNLGKIAIGSINNLYTIVRIMNYDFVTNSIIYVDTTLGNYIPSFEIADSGNIEIIMDYLKLLGFSCIKFNKNNYTDEERCVKNVIPFDKFFECY